MLLKLLVAVTHATQSRVMCYHLSLGEVRAFAHSTHRLRKVIRRVVQDPPPLCHSSLPASSHPHPRPLSREGGHLHIAGISLWMAQMLHGLEIPLQRVFCCIVNVIISFHYIWRRVVLFEFQETQSSL